VGVSEMFVIVSVESSVIDGGVVSSQHGRCGCGGASLSAV